MSPRLSDLLLSSQSDERLVSLARAGHERAFAAIVERYRPELHALARRLCSDGRSEDVVQQAFLSAFAALRSGGEVRHLRGWLYRIVRNTAGRPETPTLVPLDGTTLGVDVLEDVVQQRAMAMTALSEIARLPARQRQAMIGTALDGRPRAEIASSMGLSEGAVRQLVHRARATLRSAVTALTPWPLVRWIAAAGPDAPGPGELAAGAGAASSGGLALKLGALLASGTFLTGAAVHLQARPAHRADTRAATPVHARRSAPSHARPVAVASVTSPVLARAVSPPAGSPRSQPISPARRAPRPIAHVGAPQRIARHGQHSEGSAGAVPRSGGSRVTGHDDGRGDRTGSEESSGRGGHDGAGAFLPSGSGAGSDDSATQMVSDSHSLDSGVDGSDSRHGSDSGSGTSDGPTLTSTPGGDSTSNGGSGSGHGSGSGDGDGTSGG